MEASPRAGVAGGAGLTHTEQSGVLVAIDARFEHLLGVPERATSSARFSRPTGSRRSRRGDVFARTGVDFAAGLMARNRDVVRWIDQVRRGFLRLTLDRRRATAGFMAVSNVTSKDYAVTRDAAFEALSDPQPGLGPITPVIERQNKR
jgi:hypothetical protein